MYERFPNNVEILASLADYYSHKGEVDKAISILKKMKDFLEFFVLYVIMMFVLFCILWLYGFLFY